MGDGGNDVGMIIEADIGVGLTGKEGMQASYSADYSISEFSYLKDLIIWHGRNSLRRTQVMFQFILYRGLLVSTVQIIFTVQFNFIQQPLYKEILLIGYSLFFTVLPILTILIDYEITKEKAFQFSILYHHLKHCIHFQTRNFFCILWISIFQGSIVIIVTLLLQNEI